ncbi:hypothetical protein MRX96_004110 [Rhipicephalus microplus]
MSERCAFCSNVFLDVHILCVECDPKVTVCIRCFSRGVESLMHKNDHQYSVVTTEFPLLCKTWTAAEELKLLDALLECGIGNWSDIAKHVASKSAKECESHYLQHYIYAPQGLLKGIVSEPSSIGSCQLAPVPYRDALSPASATFTDFLPPVLLVISPPGTGLPLFEALLVAHHHEAVTTEWPHGPLRLCRPPRGLVITPPMRTPASLSPWRSTPRGFGAVPQTPPFRPPPYRASTTLHRRRVTSPLSPLPRAVNLSPRPSKGLPPSQPYPSCR